MKGISIIFIQSGNTYQLVIISFSLTIGMVIRKIVALIVVNICELCTLLSEITSIMCITCLLAPFSLLLFVIM